MLLAAGSVPAAIRTWTGGGADNNWSTAANWGGTAPAAGDNLVFAGTTRLSPVNNMTPSTAFASVSFSAGAGNFTVSGNAITLTGGAAAVSNNATAGTLAFNNDITFTTASPTIATAAGSGFAMNGNLSPGSLPLTILCNGNMILGGTLSGSGGVLKDGPARLDMWGNNNYTGPTVISAGILSLGSATALGTAAGGTSVSAGAMLDLNGTNYTFAENLTLNGMGNAGSGALANSSASPAVFAGLITLGSPSGIVGESGPIDITNAGTITGSGSGLTLGGSAGGTLASVLGTGPGGLTKQGPGTWILTGANTYAGPTLIAAGLLKLGAAGTLPDNSALTVNGGLDLNAHSETVGSLAGSGTVDNSAGGGTFTLTAGGNNNSTAFSGLLKNTVATVALVKTGTGALALSGPNTYAGPTTINDGVIKLGNLAALGASAGGVTVASGASLDLNGVNYAAAEPLTLNGNGTGNIGALINSNAAGAAYAGPISLGSNSGIIAQSGAIDIANTGDIPDAYTLTLGGAQGGSFSGTLSGGYLAKIDAGTWTLTGVNPLALISLSLSGGTLHLGSSHAHSVSSTLALTGGTLDFGSSTLRVAAPAVDLSALAGVVAGSGTLEFTSASNQQFTPKAGAPHPILLRSGSGTTMVMANVTAAGLSMAGGTLDIGTHTAMLTVSGDLAMNGGTLDASDGGIAVGGNINMTSGSFTAPRAGGAFNLAGSIAVGAGMAFSPNDGALTLNGAAAGKLVDITPSLNRLIVNNGSGTWTVSHALTVAASVAVLNGTLDIDTYGITLTADSLKVAGGTLTAPNGNLSVGSDFLMTSGALSAPDNGKAFSVGGGFVQSGGSLFPHAGTLILGGSGSNKAIGNTSPLNALSISGAGSWTAVSPGIRTNALTLASGTLNLGTGLTHQIDGPLTGNGALEFGGAGTAVYSKGDVNLMSMTVTAGPTHRLRFAGTGNQVYSANTATPIPNIEMYGTGILTFGRPVIASTLVLNTGTLNLGSSWTHSVSTTLTTSGGTLDFGSSTLEVQAAAIDFHALASITPGVGRLKFTGASAQTFLPLAAAVHPAITQYGTGGTTLAGGLTAGALTLNQGTFKLGAGLSHTFTSVSDGGGGPYGSLDFGSSQLRVSGNVSLGNAPNLIPGTGTLDFNGSGATQIFTPKGPAASHPLITHTGTGTVRLSGNALYCLGFSQTAGTWDFNGLDLTTTAAGDFAIGNGTSASFANLGGRTVTVAGNAALNGQTGDHLGLNFSPAWTLSVGGSLHALNADIGNSQANLSSGTADSSQNLSGNAHWLFLDGVKPDNVTSFTADAVDGHAVALSWTASISSDADSVMLRYRTDGQYPSGPGDGTLLRTVPKSRNLDTATGLPDKAVFRFAAFARDSSGNFALSAAGARDTARTPDVTPPANVTAFIARALGPAAHELSWTPSASGDADSVTLRYRIDGTYPTGPSDGALFRTVPMARGKDTVPGLAPDQIYHFSAFARDSSGNYSAASASARDTSLYRVLATGSIAIADLSGRTRDPDPALAFTWSNADSLRFSTLADTGTAAWKALHSVDSLDLSAGADGPRTVAAQFKRANGIRSPWYLDTTLLDRTAPVVALKLSAAHSWRNWPNAVAGRALDAVAGTDSVFVVRRRQADGFHFNGSGWSTVADTARLRADSVFSVPMPGTAMATGDYDFTAYAKDKAGNLSAPQTLTVAYQENRPPSLASATLPDTAAQNAAVAWKVDLGDPDAGDSLVTVTSTIPAWLTLSETADTAGGGFPAHRIYTFAGTPGQADVGNASITLQARDLGGLTYTFAKTVAVRDVNDAPVFSTGQDSLQAFEDSVTRFVPRYTDPDPNDPHTLSLLQAPAWATLADSALVFRPGGRDVGRALVRLTVGDGKLLDTLDLVVKVADANDAPVAFPGAGWQSPAQWKEDAAATFTAVVVDMDPGDPITLATALPAWITYTASIDSANGFNHFFRFTAAPAQKDTGSYALKLRFRDAAGAFSELSLPAKVAAVNDAPMAVIKGSRTLAGAARITLDVSDEDGSAAATRFHYRLIGAAGDTVRRGICPSTMLDLRPLADGDYRLAVAAEDEGGLKQAGFTFSPLKITGATVLALDSGRWNMIGYPGRALGASSLGAGAATTSWDETSGDGAPLGRYAAGSAADSLARGKGYWVRAAKPVTLSAPLAELLDKPFALKLTHGKQGWNQIGNPYPYYLDLSASGLQFWEWDAARRDLSDAHGILKPWGAYWVQVRKDTALTLKDDPYFPPASGNLAKDAAYRGGTGDAAPARAGAWTLQMALQAGPYQDRANFLGIREVTQAPGAPAAGAEGKGAASLLPEPPKFGDYIALRFEKTGTGNGDGADSLAQGYAEDFRGGLDADEEWWDFSVRNSASGFDKAALTLPGLKALEDAGLHAFLVRKGETVPLAAEVPVTLSMEGAATHYSLVVTPHADFAERLRGDFSVSQNFPNPVASQTAFRFFLPETWDANGKREAKVYRLRLNVYDFSGRLAAQVADGGFKPGSHTLIWKPRAKGGGALAKGSYLYRLEVPGFAKTLKLLVK